MSEVSRLAIRVRGDRAELALASLLPLLAGGAEERAVGGDVEYVLYGRSGALPPAPLVEEALGDMLVGCSVDAVEPGWERRWHEFLRPVTVGPVTVRPPWVDGAADDVVIDPDLYFGAGSHATTQLALELLLAEPTRGGALSDWGAGCGVLAVAAARLGWDPVSAVELEPGALDVIRRNAAANGVRVSAVGLDLAHEPAPWAPTVVVNVPAPLLLALPRVVERPPERLLMAGMLASEASDIAGEFAPLGLREDARLVAGEWAAVRLVRG